MRKRSAWRLYILRCADGALYTGIAKNVGRRIAQHARGKGSRFLRGRAPFVLVHQESFSSINAALRREAAVKRLTRQSKLALISGIRGSVNAAAARTAAR